MPVLSDAPFYLPLNNSLTLQNGAGTFTFGRTSSAGIVDSATGLYIVLTPGNPRYDSVKRLYRNPAAVTNTLLYSRSMLSGANAGKWLPSVSGFELVTNGTFDTNATGWTTYNCSLSVTGGQCTFTASGDNPYMSRSFSTAIGKQYKVSCNLISDSMTGTNLIKVGTVPGSGNIVGLGLSVGVENSFCFTATGTTAYVSVSGGAGVSGQNIVVDNISVKDSDVTMTTDQTGIDATANSCTKLTANVGNATISQTITAAASAGCAGVYVKRSVGAGNVWFTRDNYTTLLDITDLINSSTFTLVALENTSVLNPVVGFKFETSGDAVIVDGMMNHLGTEIDFPIFTTTAAVTVNAETLTYQTAGNFSDTAGTIIATVERTNWANNNGVVVGKAGSGLSTSASNSGVQALDGTNTVNGPVGSTMTRRKIGMKWSGSTMKTFAGGNFGASGSYDGSFNLTTIAIMPQSNGYIRDVAIWPTELSDEDMLSAASEQSDFSASVSFASAAYANVIHSVSASMPINIDVTGDTSVIHSVSASMAIEFNAAMRANVIHSVSADLSIAFDADFTSTWIIPSLKIDGSYDPPVIQGTYGPTT